jgi:hypothetical protein
MRPAQTSRSNSSLVTTSPAWRSRYASTSKRAALDVHRQAGDPQLEAGCVELGGAEAVAEQHRNRARRH